jgi:hypothetical protein
MIMTDQVGYHSLLSVFKFTPVASFLSNRTTTVLTSKA